MNIVNQYDEKQNGFADVLQCFVMWLQVFQQISTQQNTGSIQIVLGLYTSCVQISAQSKINC